MSGRRLACLRPSAARGRRTMMTAVTRVVDAGLSRYPRKSESHHRLLTTSSSSAAMSKRGLWAWPLDCRWVAISWTAHRRPALLAMVSSLRRTLSCVAHELSAGSCSSGHPTVATAFGPTAVRFACGRLGNRGAAAAAAAAAAAQTPPAQATSAACASLPSRRACGAFGIPTTLAALGMPSLLAARKRAAVDVCAELVAVGGGTCAEPISKVRERTTIAELPKMTCRRPHIRPSHFCDGI
mmetsp:Transcript_112930/g.364557  ORF Transcript_112930/g.364557 Transcript_112930/m.364557 type:complete len:240 (-) Transcript_112930:30-749(-)